MSKIVYLDFIRILAVWMVLYGHLIGTGTFALDIPSVFSSGFEYNGKTLPIMDASLHNMYAFDLFLGQNHTASACIGVVLFFWLAGYLCVSSRMKSVGGGQFLLKRSIRLMTGLWIAIALCGVIAYSQGISYSIGIYFWNMVLLEGIMYYPCIIGTMWALSVEYIFSILLSHIKKLSMRNIFIVDCLCLLTVCLYLETPSNVLMNLTYVSRFIPVILFGAVIKIYKDYDKSIKFVMLNGLISYATIFLACNYIFTFDIYYKSIVTYIVCGIIWFVAANMENVFQKLMTIKLIHKTVNFLVDTSYMVFLLQLNVGLTVMFYISVWNNNPYIIILSGIIMTYIVSSIMHYFVEKKLLNLISRRF